MSVLKVTLVNPQPQPNSDESNKVIQNVFAGNVTTASCGCNGAARMVSNVSSNMMQGIQQNMMQQLLANIKLKR